MKRFLNRLATMFAPVGGSFGPTDLSMSDEEFLLAVLALVPEGSRLAFDQSEPEGWVPQIGRWAFRRNTNQFEADYYRIDPEFLAVLRSLIAAKPNALGACHHLSVIGPDGVTILDSLDNFSVVKLAKNIEEALQKRGNTEQKQHETSP